MNRFSAKEISDSKGTPTIEVELRNGFGVFRASVPSGVSTGKYEAKNVSAGRAVKNIEKIIAPALEKEDIANQKQIDKILKRINVGANAILPVSIAVCRAAAKTENLFLWQYISKIAGTKAKLPVPSVLMAEGGLHALPAGRQGNGGSDIQEFMVAGSFVKTKKIYQNLKKYKFKTGLEGGFVMPFENPEEILDLIIKAAKTDKIKIILDIAASHESAKKTPEYYLSLAKQYPIFAIEDPFSQDDWARWQKLSLPAGRQGKKLLLVGDDLTVTNSARIKIAHQKKACNAVIIKPNQIGTVTETIEAAKLAKSYNWKTIVSHRSGETMDDFIADLAVGIGADFIKSGAPFPKERMAKYNRLAKIEKELQK